MGLDKAQALLNYNGHGRHVSDGLVNEIPSTK